MAEKISVMIATVILVVIAAILYPLVGTQVADLTDNTSDNYVGDDTAPIVGMIPIFYWLAVVLVVIGIAMVTLREST